MRYITFLLSCTLVVCSATLNITSISQRSNTTDTKLDLNVKFVPILETTGAPSFGDVIVCYNNITTDGQQAQLVLSGGICESMKSDKGKRSWGDVRAMDTKVASTIMTGVEAVTGYKRVLCVGQNSATYYIVLRKEACVIATNQLVILTAIIEVSKDTDYIASPSANQYTHHVIANNSERVTPICVLFLIYMLSIIYVLIWVTNEAILMMYGLVFTACTFTIIRNRLVE